MPERVRAAKKPARPKYSKRCHKFQHPMAVRVRRGAQKYLDIKINDMMYLNAMNIV
jgi:hypothetical protein